MARKALLWPHDHRLWSIVHKVHARSPGLVAAVSALTTTTIQGHRSAMTKSKGRTGAHTRAHIQPPPTAADIEAARREVVQIEGRLAGLAAGHPSVKIWKTRLRAAQAILARAPREPGAAG